MKQLSSDIEHWMAGTSCSENNRKQLGLTERGTTVPQEALAGTFIREELTQDIRTKSSQPVAASSACRKRLACIMETQRAIAILLDRDLNAFRRGASAAQNATAIYVQNLAGNMTGQRRCQKQDGSRDVVWRGYSLQRDRRFDCLAAAI